MEHKMKLTIGDWSWDGHGLTEVKFLRSSHSREEIADAYKTSCKSTEIDFAAECASEYEDQSFPAEKFLELGCNRDVLRHDNSDEEDVSEWNINDADHMFNLLVWFCQLSLPDLKLEAVMDEIPELVHDVGNGLGYGLFSL